MVDKNKFADIEGYHISITGKNVVITDAMKACAIEKLSKIDRFSQDIIDVHVIMDLQKMEHRVDFILSVGHTKIKVHYSSQDIYMSIDKGVDRLQARLRKYKSRLQEHRSKDSMLEKNETLEEMNVKIIPAPIDFLEECNDAIDDENQNQIENIFGRPHEIIKTETRPLKTLTVDEAVMNLDLSQDFFLIYRSEEDKKIKVVYRRADDHFGIIEVH